MINHLMNMMTAHDNDTIEKLSQLKDKVFLMWKTYDIFSYHNSASVFMT